MKTYHFERAVISAFGFLLGTGIAVCITPGDFLLWILAGVVLGIFCHEHFLRDYGGGFLWMIPHRHRHPPKPPVKPGG